MAVSDLDWRQGGRQLAIVNHIVPPGASKLEIPLIAGAEDRPVFLSYIRFMAATELDGAYRIELLGVALDPLLVCDVSFTGGWGFVRPSIIIPGGSLTVHSSTGLDEVLLGLER